MDIQPILDVVMILDVALLLACLRLVVLVFLYLVQRTFTHQQPQGATYQRSNAYIYVGYQAD